MSYSAAIHEEITELFHFGTTWDCDSISIFLPETRNRHCARCDSPIRKTKLRTHCSKRCFIADWKEKRFGGKKLCACGKHQVLEFYGNSVCSYCKKIKAKVSKSCAFCSKSFVAYKHAKTCSASCRTKLYKLKRLEKEVAK